MTKEQLWRCAAIHARGIVLGNPDAMIANGVIWADDRIKALEKELKKETFDKVLAQQSLNTLKLYIDEKG